MRPTTEEIANSRQLLIGDLEHCVFHEAEMGAVRVLLAATEPATDEAIATFASKLYSLVGTPSSAESILARIKSKEPIGALGIADIVFATARHFLGSPNPK